jgi:hypothetical protein
VEEFCGGKLGKGKHCGSGLPIASTCDESGFLVNIKEPATPEEQLTLGAKPEALGVPSDGVSHGEGKEGSP